jgi:cell division protein FtsI/penicillin-binding protein 2
VIREERECHPIIEGLSKRDEINIRLWHLPRFPTLVRLGALEITDSTRRVYPEGEALAHVVGLLAEADVDIIEKRPFVIDSGASSSEIPGRSPQQPRRIDWGGYRLGDMRGSTGVEWLAEDELRGQRGQVEEFIDGRPPERAEPRPGRDVAISIDARLQQRVYQVLHQAIAAHQQTQGWKLIPGASVVVLDVATREVLAMTSYPSFSPQTFREDYDELIDDQEGRPLINRAVQVQYCPGSIVKPITIVAAHEEGLIDLDTRLECRGALHPDRPGVFRCWRPAGHSVPNQHGMITAQEAIRGSCNVFCYRLGNEFCEHFGGPVGGVARMCEWLQRFGVGRLTEVGLPGEKKGFLPTPEWLQRGPLHSRQPVTADARNYAIGQGEVEVTPLQAANIAATLASGDMRPVTLRIGNDGLAVQRLPVDEAMWRAIRSGMYDVVNHPDGTAPGARLRHDGFCLCGKSGSAQTPRWPTEFRVRHAHGEEEIEAGSESEARRLFIAKHPQFKPADLDVQCVAWFPDRPAEEGRSYSHAWFAAFIQPMSGGSPAWSQPAPLAIVVLLEFGGSGGSVAAPLCRDVADMIIEEFPEYVRTQTESDALGSRFDFLDR